ncbi:MAG: GAF domain-containing protein [Deltaproteobacteria bacterium]|nr:GAF domain-containing protein [Deltaproteobacteria bacterium]
MRCTVLVSLVYLLLPGASAFILFGLGLGAVIRAPGTATNRLFAALTVLGACINADIVLVTVLTDKDIALTVDRIAYLFFVFSIPLYIRFVHSFLAIEGRRFLEITGYCVSFVFLPFTQTPLFVSGLQEYYFGAIAKAGPLYHCFMICAAATVFYCLATLRAALSAAATNSERNRIKYILAGIGGSSLLFLFNYAPLTGFPLYPPGNFIVIPSLFLAYGVLKFDLLDMGILVRRSVIYGTMTVLASAVYIVVIGLINAFFTGADRSHPLVAATAMAAVVVLALQPLQSFVQRSVDRFVFGSRYDYQDTLKHFSGDLTKYLVFEDIGDFLEDSLKRILEPESVRLIVLPADEEVQPDANHRKVAELDEGNVGVFLATDIESFFVNHREPLSLSALESAETKEKERLLSFFNKHAAVLVAPVLSKEKLLGVIALGQKMSGMLYVKEDMELLATVAHQCAIALENARRYEEIMELNRLLEFRVSARTEALKAALVEKERTQELLIRSESLAAVGQLVAGVAHELNNPLAGASSLMESSLEFLEVRRKHNEGENELMDDLRFARKEILRAAAIVKSLLGLSRQTSRLDETVYPSELIEDALRVLHNQRNSPEMEIVQNFADDLPPIRGNFSSLGQVFINVIRNAIQALPGGAGRIVITGETLKKQKKIRINVSDTGPGIPPAVLKDIFKPFFTTKAPGKGTGLGLYIAHEIVRRHGGIITVKSPKEGGTTVSIELGFQGGCPDGNLNCR